MATASRLTRARAVQARIRERTRLASIPPPIPSRSGTRLEAAKDSRAEHCGRRAGSSAKRDSSIFVRLSTSWISNSELRNQDSEGGSNVYGMRHGVGNPVSQRLVAR